MKSLRLILIGILLVAMPAALGEPVRAATGHAPTSKAPTGDPATWLTSGTVGKALLSYYSAAQIARGVYVGTEFCLACHTDKAAFKNTQHSYALIRPMTQYTLVPTKGVLADTNGNGKDDFIDGLDFNAVSSAFDKYKPNAPKLSVENGRYVITIAALKMPVTFVRQWREADGSWLQRYVVKVPVSDSSTGFTKGNYLSGLKHQNNGAGWSSDGIESLYDASNQPKFTSIPTTPQFVGSPAGGSFETCAGCHTTGIQTYAKNTGGEWVMTPYPAILYNADDPAYFDYNGDGTFELLNIGCESCHGPGSPHILRAGNGGIANPAKLSASQQLDVCGQCHSRLKSLPNKTFSFPLMDDTMTQWVPGTPMEPFYADPSSSYWPDGKTPKSTHMEFIATKTSIHFTNPYEKLSCSECHSSHEATGAGQILESRKNGSLTIKTEAENNTLCLSCHATYGPFAGITAADVAAYGTNVEKIGSIVSKHSNHPYGPERSMGLGRCIECHMPKAGTPPGGTDYLVRSHYFEAISPEKTVKYATQGGMPNACAVACHQTKANLFSLGLDPTPNTWNATFDAALAKELLKYYGPGGKWWNTAPKATTAPSR